MSSTLPEGLLVVLCVLAVLLLIFALLMVFLCLECLKKKNNQAEGNRLSWLSFLNINPKGDNAEAGGGKNIFSFSKHKEQPVPASAESFVLTDSAKTSYVDIVPQYKGVYKSIVQDSDTESQFSFNSEHSDHRKITLFTPLESSTCGTITCSIKFYHFANRLAVRVGEVKLNLIENIVVNPYVKLHLIPEHKRGNRQTTRVKRNSTVFVCDEDFLFSVGSREVRTKSLSLQIYDYKSNTRHLCIGKVNINLTDFDFKDEDKPLSLKHHISSFKQTQEYFGALQLALCMNPESLRIGVIKAEGLIPVDMSGALDPYCRILLYVGSELIHKKKTSIAGNTKCPVWEEFLTLDFAPKTLLCDISLTIEIRDHLRNSRTTSYLLVGRVTLSSTSVGHGATQWEHVASRRGTTVTEWQPIFA